jgi:hypothetical protein
VSVTGGSGNVSAGGATQAEGGASQGGAPNTTTCGGIAALQCPDSQVCVDSPDDGCDPNNGGADCGGFCAAFGAAPTCGGIAAIQCDKGLLCVDAPSDGCDPATGADCGGVCISAADTVMCGGIAAIQCSSGFSCVDDPRDDCDPAAGGADCGGVCAPDSDKGVDCNLSQILCKRLPPECPAGFTPSVDNGCFGPCVPVGVCGCLSSAQCPAGTACATDLQRCTAL